jgi:hypothetical protein
VAMTADAPVSPLDLTKHTGFLLAEDEALKKRCSGLMVPKTPGGEMEEVGVWFRFPEGERQLHYPFITLDLIAVEPEYRLWTSDYYLDPIGLYQPSVSPTLPLPPGGWTTHNYTVRNFIPMHLIYQVAAHTRSALHDRYLMSYFMTTVFPPRPFWLGVDADNTWRRTEHLGYAAADALETTESGTKRIFRKVHTLSMLAEIPQERFIEVYRVLRVLVAVTEREKMDLYFQDILNQSLDPINEFTQEERESKGEHFHFTHEGVEVPTAV